MKIAQLTTRAVRVRKLYAERATEQRGAPWTRAEIAQGFVGDVGDLMKLVMTKEGRRTNKAKNVDAALAHELADCLWSVLVLSDAYKVDLESAFLKMLKQLERKLTPPRRTKTVRMSLVRRGSPGPRSRSGPRTES